MEPNHPILTEAGLDLTLLSNFIHQVINPLNAVAGTLDNLAHGVVHEPHRREQRLRVARAQLEQCITLMRNLAFLSQNFRPMSVDERSVTVLPQVIIEAAMFYQEEGNNRNIKISLTDPTTQNRVMGHPDLIRQVLMNIFDNFIKYGKHAEPVKIEQRLQAGTDNAVIVVNGISTHAINQDEINHLCDIGFRGQNARQVVASGTGLGLYICKRIVEDVHGGRLHIQRAPNNGIEFMIKLPHAQAPQRK